MTGVDYSRRGKASKRKGATGEREVLALIRELGGDTAHRNTLSGGLGGGDLSDLPVWLADIHVEIKRVERLDLSGAWRQADAAKRPTESILVAHRGNSQPWLGTMLLTDVIALGPFHWSPVVVSPRQSVRAEFMARLRVHAHPLVVHQVAGECVATGLLGDVLELLAMRGPA